MPPDALSSRPVAFVLKLHRDALPARGELFGRVEHLANGTSAVFASGAELIAWLAGQPVRRTATFPHVLPPLPPIQP
ncbi:MAG: hypothetical protein KF788_06000 [Piscinibacter sp.]|nr:hypothetical protein [Piscinibacter sp.]